MKAKTRKFLLSLLVMILAGGLAFGGWTWYDNNVDRSGWVETENAAFYRDFHGKKVTGWQSIDGSQYHFGPDAALSTGWLVDAGARYYLGSDGKLQTGWQEIDGNRYYFSESGKMHTSWLDWENGRYYLDETGVLLTGWQTIGDRCYYFGSDGRMYTGWADLESLRYYFDGDGAMVTGWLDWEEKRFFLDENGNPITGWAELEENTYFFASDGSLTTGWADLEESRYYFSPEGILLTSWQDIAGSRYYLGEDGRMYTGWLTLGEYSYYLQPDGAMAVGPTEIDGETLYFTPKGIHVVLVNRWHPVSEGYTVDLVALEGSQSIDSRCAEAAQQMLAACRADGLQPWVSSGYRSYSTQHELFYGRVNDRVAEGMDYNTAWGETSRSVAIPGTSEHQLGLAMDISGGSSTTNAQVYSWLAEHCWEYGFILRYLDGKTDLTGIYYEPWHVRYVGTEISLDMKDSGLCLEEYLGAASE